MPKFDVKLSYTFDDWQSKKIVKRTETQRQSGRTVDRAVEAAIENLVEEHGSSVWDIKVVSTRKITPKKNNAPSRKPQAKCKPMELMTMGEIEACEERDQRCILEPLAYCHGCGDCERIKKKPKAGKRKRGLK